MLGKQSSVLMPPLCRHKSRGTKDIGRQSITNQLNIHQSIKYDWLDPQVRISYAHLLGKHA